VGSGWQAHVAYINLGCYYLIGLPLGYLFGWAFHQGVMVRALFLFLSLYETLKKSRTSMISNQSNAV
jgi:Na+-driven multidrug efflux pump